MKVHTWSTDIQLIGHTNIDFEKDVLPCNKKQKMEELNVDRLLNTEEFFTNLCTNFKIKPCTFDSEIQNPRMFLLLLISKSFHLSEVHIGNVIVVCAYIAFVMTLDDYPSLYDMIDLINTEKDDFYKKCVFIFPKILKELNCELPKKDEKFQRFCEKEELQWMWGGINV
jgi:hypothetical protein